MSKVFEDGIDERMAAWIARQRLFFVATAPSGDGGHVNVSPKGPIETLRVLDEHTRRLPRPHRQRRRDGRAPARQRAHRRHALRLRGPAAHRAAARPRHPRRRRGPRLPGAPTGRLPEQPGTGDPRRRSSGSPTPAASASRSWPTRASAPQSPALGADQAAQGRARRARRLRGGAERGEHRRAARARLTRLMRFEKWQALATTTSSSRPRARGAADARARGRALRPPHRRRRRRRARAAPPDEPGFVARAADLQPRRLGGRAERQRRAPGDPLPAPRAAGPTRASSRSRPIAGEIRPTILSTTTCRVDMGRARVRLPRRDGAGEAAAASRFQHLSIGNPQTAIALADPADARRARPRGHRPADRDRPAVPPAAPTSRWFTALDDAHHPRADLRARGGGDRSRRAPAPAARPSPTSCAAATRRSPSGSTAASSRSRWGRTSTSTSPGWAVPVFSGEIDLSA